MHIDARCPTCHHRAKVTVTDGTIAVVDVIVEGGARQPSSHRSIAAWHVWRRARDGELGPVIGSCAKCNMPLIADSAQAPWATQWTLDCPAGDVVVGKDSLTGPNGDLSDAQAESYLQEHLAERFTARDLLDPANFFLLAIIFVLGLIFLAWGGAFLFVLNFLYAASVQGDVVLPLTSQ